jgi:hypothetical protein
LVVEPIGAHAASQVTLLIRKKIGYEAPFFASIASSLSQGQQHFLYVLEMVGQQKLAEVRAVAVAGTDEDLMAVILNVGQKTFSTCAATYSLTADASTSSFSNIDGSNPFSSVGSGSWQPVDNEPPLPGQSSARAVPALPDLDFDTQTDHSVPVGTSNPKEAIMDGREMNMDRNPQILSPNAPYVGTSRNSPNNYNYGTPLGTGYPATGQTAYHNPPSGQTTYPDVPSRQVADSDGPNPSTTEMPGTIWPPNMFIDMNAPFQTVNPNIPNRWGDQVFVPNYRGFGGAP